MTLIVNQIIIICLILEPILTTDVCTSRQCTCETGTTIVKCDSKSWTTLENIEFPTDVQALTLIDNKLNFYKIDDRSKIESLKNLLSLNLNRNPLGTIPPFNDSKARTLSMQSTALSSAEFPSSYMGSFLQAILLNDNKIHSINENDFAALRNSKIKRLSIDNASLSKIDQNAFVPLLQLQSLSLQNNQLKACEFLSTLRVLASVKLDGNQFTTLPQQLSTEKTIKTFFFKNNLISIIDESSPLNTWLANNYTNVKVYLANNPLDCCQSLWFIKFLNTSSHFVGDAQLLTCATPSKYAGKSLKELNPNEMDCGSIIPSGTWWTTLRIIGIIVGGSVGILVFIVIIIIVTRRRQEQSRSGYREIGENDDSSVTAPLLSSNYPAFPTYGEDDDAVSTYSTAHTENTVGSERTTSHTVTGVSANDENVI